MRGWVGALLLWGCNGDSGTTDTDGAAGTCDEIEVEPLTSVPATEWDPALSAAFVDYDSLAGRWNAVDACGGTVGIKILTPDRETMDIVTQPWTTERLICGCVNDPLYGDDTQFTPLATFDGFQFYIETFDDPGVQGQTIVGSGSLFGDAPFTVRGCAVTNIDPALGSAWDQVTAILRVEGGVPTGALVLANKEQEVTSCALTDWQLVQKL